MFFWLCKNYKFFIPVLVGALLSWLWLNLEFWACSMFLELPTKKLYFDYDMLCLDKSLNLCLKTPELISLVLSVV